MKEFIICAAIYINDKTIHSQQPENITIGFVICGRRHHNCYQTIRDLKCNVNKYFKSLNLSEDELKNHQGFLTSFDRYITRKEAYIVAKTNNQIQFGAIASDNGKDSILISENLY